MTRDDIERAYNEIVGSGYGFNQCHESTMKTAAKVLNDALSWIDNCNICNPKRENISIKELYEWALINNLENAIICIQYRDDGGDYSGFDGIYSYPPDVRNVDGKSYVVL